MPNGSWGWRSKAHCDAAGIRASSGRFVTIAIGKNGAVLIRPRRDDDLPACLDVLHQVHVLDGYPRYLPGDLMAFLDAPQAYGAWVAEIDGAVVGHVALVPRSSQPVMTIATAALDLPESSLGVVARLFVAPHARRGGTGAALLETAVAETRARGLFPVLDVVSDALAAMALYEGLGWIRAGQATVRFGDGQLQVRCAIVATNCRARAMLLPRFSPLRELFSPC